MELYGDYFKKSAIGIFLSGIFVGGSSPGSVFVKKKTKLNRLLLRPMNDRMFDLIVWPTGSLLVCAGRRCGGAIFLYRVAGLAVWANIKANHSCIIWFKWLAIRQRVDVLHARQHHT